MMMFVDDDEARMRERETEKKERDKKPIT